MDFSRPMKTLLTLLAAAGFTGAALAAENWTKPQQEVADVFTAWAVAIKAGDIDGELSLTAPAFTAWDYAKLAPQDRVAYRQSGVELNKRLKVVECDLPVISIVIAGDLAVAHGRYKETMQTGSGDRMTVHGPWTSTLVRQNGKWLVLGLSFVEDRPKASRTDPATAEQELVKLENEWCAAYVAKDTGAMGRIEADGWICTTADGELVTRAEDIADVGAGVYVATEFKIEDVKVRVHGDTAIVTGRQTEKATYKGKDASGVFRITDTWIRRDGRWQCIATHLTKIAGP